jgi:hypothetical protein
LGGAGWTVVALSFGDAFFCWLGMTTVRLLGLVFYLTWGFFGTPLTVLAGVLVFFPNVIRSECGARWRSCWSTAPRPPPERRQGISRFPRRAFCCPAQGFSVVLMHVARKGAAQEDEECSSKSRT